MARVPGGREKGEGDEAMTTRRSTGIAAPSAARRGTVRSDPPTEADAVARGGRPDAVCDSGCGTAPRTAVGEGPVPDRRALRPGEPTTDAVRTAAEDCTRFEASSEEGCATGAACAPRCACGANGRRRAEDGRSGG